MEIVVILVLLLMGALAYYLWPSKPKPEPEPKPEAVSDPAVYLRSIDHNLQFIKNCIIWSAIIGLIYAVINFAVRQV